jgi:Putative transposase of IS4/5 family (DUF4096)
MRCEFSEHEWTAIKPMLPNKPRGVRWVDDRRVLDAIVCVLRSGAPWRDLPATYGHDMLQSLRSVDDDLVSLICPTCQTSNSALDECGYCAWGCFQYFGWERRGSVCFRGLRKAASPDRE